MSSRQVSLTVAVVSALILFVGGRTREALGQHASDSPAWTYQELDDDKLDLSIKMAVAGLWKVTNEEGTWELASAKDYAAALKDPKDRTATNSISGTAGGATSLVLLAMLKSGVSQDDPKFQKALKFVLDAKPTQTYAHALRAALLASLDRPQLYTRYVQGDSNWLQNAMYADGTYSYNPPVNRTFLGAARRDLSNTQYGVLGMWLISDYNAEVPLHYWSQVQSAYLGCQAKDGGWGYEPKPTETGYQSMTAGALASLFIVWDRLYTAKPNQVPDPALVKGIEGGLKWLATNFNPAQNAGKSDNSGNEFLILYSLYGVERVGAASGVKYFGDKDWWGQCARYLLTNQQADGLWPGLNRNTTPAAVATAWALLTLSHGRAPVAINKLAYGDSSQWNCRPRDLARLTHWMGRACEKTINWQVVPSDRPVQELLEAPILYLSGRSAIALGPEQKDKLKDYVQRGGLLFGEAIDGSKEFADSFRALMRELFPDLEMRKLPATHPIYTAQFQVGKLPTTAPAGTAGPQINLPPLEGLSTGVRTLVVLSTNDMSAAWQMCDLGGKRPYFELAANLVQYASDRSTGLLTRGNSYVTKDLGFNPDRRLTVGRLVWGSRAQWDPEPYAWKRMEIYFRNIQALKISLKELTFAKPVPTRLNPVVHLTGCSRLELSDDQKHNLKKYVTEGGVLIVDSAGGNKDFTESFQKLAGDLFGKLQPEAPPFLLEKTNKGQVTMRHVDGLPRAVKPLEVLTFKTESGHYGLLFFPYDLTAAMTGNPNMEAVGVVPSAAEKLIEGILTHLPRLDL